jgi:hypothetical protein
MTWQEAESIVNNHKGRTGFRYVVYQFVEENEFYFIFEGWEYEDSKELNKNEPPITILYQKVDGGIFSWSEPMAADIAIARMRGDLTEKVAAARAAAEKNK